MPADVDFARNATGLAYTIITGDISRVAIRFYTSWRRLFGIASKTDGSPLAVYTGISHPKFLPSGK